MNISTIGAVGYDITPLLPTTNKKPNSIIDLLPKSNDYMSQVLQNIISLRFSVIQLPEAGKSSDKDYSKYLQFPNSNISTLAKSIVSISDSNDEKVFKIEQWVQDNITYVSDTKNYGTGEFWAYPTITMEKGKGDCEDGAFLVHSLALHAGVPPERLRTYGGLVWADPYGVTTGGHAWTSYQRETDDKWIIADWCYWAKDTPLAERITMRNDMRYVDDFWYFNYKETTETPFSNGIRTAAYLDKGTFVDLKT